MVKSVKWNKRALDTFYDTATYLEQNFSKKAADNFAQSVFDKIEVLKKISNYGEESSETKDGSFCFSRKISSLVLSNARKSINYF